MVSSSRARTGADKLARRLQIIEAALQLWDTSSYEALTMAQIAKALDLAKGTLYLSFASKEELFLAVYIGLLDEWFDQVELGLGEMNPVTLTGVTNLFVDHLASRPRLGRLISLAAGAFERNVSEETAKEYRQWRLKRIDLLGSLIEDRLSGMPPGTGADACMYFHVLAAGLGPMGHLDSALGETEQARRFAKMRSEFSEALKVGFSTLLIGFQNRYRTRT